MTETTLRSTRRFIRWLYVLAPLLVISGMPNFAEAGPAPVLISDVNSTRAIALEPMALTREPFSITSSSSLYGNDNHTRVMLFALNLTGANSSTVTVDAEDQFQHHYNLKVEYVGQVPGSESGQLSEVIVRLSDDLTNVGDVLMQLTYQGMTSNRVRIGIGYLGDGPDVLDFDGSPKSVDYGGFWPSGVDLGTFFWEFWAMPGQNASATYLISDGYGGAHAILFGMGYDTENHYTLLGNVWDGTNSTTFSSDDGPVPYEWGHFAVGWDGEKIVTYYDGVPVGKVAFSGPRRCIGGESGGGWLLIGGSTHQNWVGRIAQVRGYENTNPHADVNGYGQSLSAFAPQTIFEPDGSSLLSSFMHPAPSIPDLSGNNHTGKVRSTACGYQFDCSNDPLPQFVIDPIWPNNLSLQPSFLANPSPPEPPGARVFDSFTRRNSTYAFGGTGGLGFTAEGTAGPQVWQYSQSENGFLPFGILNGRAVMLVNNAAAAWVSTGDGPANLDIHVDRHPVAWGSGISTGLVFRLQDAMNFFVAYTSGDSASDQMLYLSSYTNGSSTDLAAGIAMPANWTTLRVVTLETGSISIYADANLVYSTTNTALAGASKAGLWNAGPGLGLANRWDNFTVLNAN